MTKKHFVALAQAVKKVATKAGMTETQHWFLANSITEVCESQNPKFDRDRFILACGVGSGQEAK
jgi:hypothetical protein